MTALKYDTEHPVVIASGDKHLDGIFHIPSGVKGLVIFAHGSGSSRFSPRNEAVARVFQEAKIATLLFDLLTLEEEEVDERTAEYRFDIELLAERLVSVCKWIEENPFINHLPRGYFGASTGGAAALLASAIYPDEIKAIVSRGGRPDLAQASLQYVTAPTLLIVGGHDETVITLNQKAFMSLQCVKELRIISGASHLFEEPGTLNDVASLALDWFIRYFVESTS